jgi:pimeloyl-ACP methyl ester carboxylesterase
METLAVRDAVRARRDANLPVILIGHSWGGSQAISTALWAKENGIRIDLLITADAVGVPDLVAPRNLSSYAARLDGIATNWVNVTADRPGTGAGDVVASIWGRTPQVIQQKATLNVSARSADHADFRNMMIAINAKGLIEGVRK